MIEFSNKKLSAKDTDAYMAAQPDVSAIFEKHKELSNRPLIAGIRGDFWTFSNGKWERHWQVSNEVWKRVEKAIREHGTQIYASQWEFPDGYDFAPLFRTEEEQVADLGFWQYVPKKEAANAD